MAFVEPVPSNGTLWLGTIRLCRFPSAQDTTTEDNGPSAWLSQSSNLSSQRTFCPDPRWVDESMLTSEQREVVDTEVDVGQTLTIVAYAGTGKTFTLRAVAQRNPTLRILYAAVSAPCMHARKRSVALHRYDRCKSSLVHSLFLDAGLLLFQVVTCPE